MENKIEVTYVDKRKVGRPRKDENIVVIEKPKPIRGRKVGTLSSKYDKKHTWIVDNNGVKTEHNCIKDISVFLKITIQKVNKIIYRLNKTPSDINIYKSYKD